MRAGLIAMRDRTLFAVFYYGGKYAFPLLVGAAAGLWFIYIFRPDLLGIGDAR